MPFPATRNADSQVGAPRDQGPRAHPRADSQVGGLFRGCEPADREVRSLHMPDIQCADLRGVPQDVGAVPLARYAHGGRAGQRPVPPCRLVGAAAAQVPTSPDAPVPAAVRTAPGPDRAGVETRKTPGHPQPLFRHTGRAAHHRRRVLRPMEKIQSSAATVMRYYLRRYV